MQDRPQTNKVGKIIQNKTVKEKKKKEKKKRKKKKFLLVSPMDLYFTLEKARQHNYEI